MSGPRYPAARSFAARLEEHFARHAAAAPSGAPTGTPVPDAAAIEALVDAAFWASLQREEGYPPEISLALLSPAQVPRPLMLAAPLPLGPRGLARLAPAVRRPGIHLGVWRERGGFVVWGTTQVIPTFCFVLEVVGPGLLVVKHRIHEDSGKFRNVAVFAGEEVKILSRQVADASDHPSILRSLLAPESKESNDARPDLLLRLAVSMRAHKRGGTLLVVPSGREAWRESLVRPIAYAVAPPFTELADLLRQAGEAGPLPPPGALARAVDAVAGLTAVDGATLLTDRYELLAFGVKIARPDGRSQVERVALSEPIEGSVAEVVAPVQLGGTRHISAAQFAQDQPDAAALAASQDGHFTVFAWSASEGLVHAHRVDTLLL
jgi:Probable sensor domain DACNV